MLLDFYALWMYMTGSGFIRESSLKVISYNQSQTQSGRALHHFSPSLKFSYSALPLEIECKAIN